MQYLPSAGLHSSGEKVVTCALVIAAGQFSVMSPGHMKRPPDPVTPAVPVAPAVPLVPATPLPVEPADPVRGPSAPPQLEKKTANESAPPAPTSADNLTTLAKLFRMLVRPFDNG